MTNDETADRGGAGSAGNLNPASPSAYRRKVERLEAALEHQTWCPDCGKVLEIPNPLAAKVERLEARAVERVKFEDALVDKTLERAAVIVKDWLSLRDDDDLLAAIRADKGDSDE